MHRMSVMLLRKNSGEKICPWIQSWMRRKCAAFMVILDTYGAFRVLIYPRVLEELEISHIIATEICF